MVVVALYFEVCIIQMIKYSDYSDQIFGLSKHRMIKYILIIQSITPNILRHVI